MASILDSIVQVTISADSRTVSRQGFGIPVVMTYHTKFVENYRVYSSLAEMAADLFSSADSAYRMAASIFAQDPTVTSIVVGRLSAAPAFSSQLTITSAVEGQHIKFKVVQPATGVVSEIDYTIPAAMTTTTVATAVELLTEAIAGVDSTSALAVVTLTPTVAGAPIHIYDLVNCEFKENTAAGSYVADLTALQIENDDWYFVTIDSQSDANVLAVATWTETEKKMFFYTTSANDELAGTGVLGSTLKAAARKRTAGIWTPNGQEHAGAGWVGAGAPKAPGSITWAYKTIAGVIPKALTSTQRGFLTTNNINQYETVAGINVTRPGMVASGAWIDEIHGIDALEADIKESVFSLLANSDKVPFTDSGFALIQNAILGAMKRFEGSIEQPGLIAIGTSKVIMPALSSINPADKAARILRGVRFSATLAGAVHTVILQGTLSNA